jgi:hypothetical protein
MRPVVILPANADEWDTERRKIVLMHELAHVKRNDCLIQIVAQVACAIYWFHPAVWYSARRMRAERELACDERVIGAGVNAYDYATHLLEIATTFRSSAGSAIVGVAMARPSQLEGRLCAILRGDLADKWRASKPLRAGAIASLVMLTIPLAAMRPAKDETPKPTAVTSGEVRSSLSFAETRSEGGFHWQGTVAAGSWIEIYSSTGDIRLRPSTDGRVEVIATKPSRGAEGVKIGIDKTQKGMQFCAVAISAPQPECKTGMRGELTNGIESARVDFVVKVPAGVGIAAHTGRGRVIAKEMQSYVWATTDEGDIEISTTDVAEASSRLGSIRATFGRRSWRENLEFLTERGDVSVRAPADARMTIEASTGSGSLASEFP